MRLMTHMRFTFGNEDEGVQRTLEENDRNESAEKLRAAAGRLLKMRDLEGMATHARATFARRNIFSLFWWQGCDADRECQPQGLV
jgi:hypothetical protein